jgi:low affinity Fe/Cu permease
MAESPARGLSKPLVSRWLSRADRFASRPLAAIFVVTAAGTWIIVSIAAGFPARWETIFQTVVAALTLAMVFVIQHTQGRHQRATQRKLDEILLAIPGTGNALLTSSTHPTTNCTPPAASIDRSARLRSRTIQRPVQAMERPG